MPVIPAGLKYRHPSADSTRIRPRNCRPKTGNGPGNTRWAASPVSGERTILSTRRISSGRIGNEWAVATDELYQTPCDAWKAASLPFIADLIQELFDFRTIVLAHGVLLYALDVESIPSGLTSFPSPLPGVVSETLALWLVS